MSELGLDGGWVDSAPAWIRGMAEQDDPNRAVLLDPVMLELSQDVAGMRVLDLGCGEGRFCRRLAARGATTVGLDVVEAMVQAARTRGSDGEAYVQGSADSLPFETGSFDLVVSYITLVDIQDYRAAIWESARVLRPGGRLLVANLTFVTASAGWLRDEAGKRLYHRVDRYLEERPLLLEWGKGIRIRNWHRPLSSYMEAYLGAGLTLRRFLEPMPKDESLRQDDYWEDAFRVPNFDVMLWEKTESN